MPKKTKLTSTRGICLFKDDEETLRRAIKSGKYENLSEAVRESVNTHLTALRLKTFRHDTAHDGVKDAQREIIEPVKKTTDKIEITTDKLLDEITELKNAVIDLVKDSSARKYTDKSETDFKQLTVSVDEIMKLSVETNSLAMQTRLNQFVLQGLMTFFAIGYHAGSIKPTALMREGTFTALLTATTKTVLKDADEVLKKEPQANIEELFIKKFAQLIFDKLHSNNR